MSNDTTASASESEDFENYFCMTLSCDGSEERQLIDACRAAAHDAWMERARRAAIARAPSQRTEGTQPSREALDTSGWEVESNHWSPQQGAPQAPLSKSEIDDIVYQCRQSGKDTTYDIVNTAISAALARAPLTDEQIDAVARKYAGMGGVEDYRAFARDVVALVPAHSREGALLNGETLANMLPPDATTIETPDGLKVCMTYKQLRKFAEVARAPLPAHTHEARIAAARARIQGVWDDPALEACGPMTGDLRQDLLRILDAADKS
jgi:hypothetical protein